MNTGGGLWRRRYVKIFTFVAWAVLFTIINSGITHLITTPRRNSQVSYSINAALLNVTHISLEYNSDIFWFYGENLALAKNYFTPGRWFINIRRNDRDVLGGTVSARVRYYNEDTFLFSATIFEVPPRTQSASVIINTDGDVILSGFFIDGTTLRSPSTFIVLNIGDLISPTNHAS